MNFSVVLGALFAVLAIIRGIFEVRVEKLDSFLAFPPVDVKLDNGEAAVKRFAGILKFRTISDIKAENHVIHPEEFQNLLGYLKASFPDVWASLNVRHVSSLILFLQCAGSTFVHLWYSGRFM